MGACLPKCLGIVKKREDGVDGRFPSFPLPDHLMEIIFRKSRFMQRLHCFEVVFRKSMSLWEKNLSETGVPENFHHEVYIPRRFFSRFRSSDIRLIKLSYSHFL
jgi:hypothetical protein